MTSIDHVTDTAYWVASIRAQETNRRDAVFEDRLAELLATDRGHHIARSFPNASIVSWGVVMRTTAIDRLVDAAMHMDVDTVINLGAGLDTRPYRMELPPQIRWIEIDFPHLIRAKESLLAAHLPKCRVERLGADLSDRMIRNSVLARCGADSAKTLLIAEGVIPYFSNEAVRLLANDCAANPAFRYWILDFDNAGARAMPKGWAKRLQAAPMLFQADDWFRVFDECQWSAGTIITTAEESARLGRPYPLTFPLGLTMRALPAKMSQKILSLSGAALLERKA